jgi:TorA maturation chaperone TorD
MKQDCIDNAVTSKSRARIYEFLLKIFACIPDQSLILEIKSPDFQDLLNSIQTIDDLRINTGIECVKSFCRNIEFIGESEILNLLSVDRTALLITGKDRKLKPPYESLYRNKHYSGRTTQSLNNYYRAKGLLPDENVGDLADYLCVELAFAHQLCLRENQQWLSGDSGVSTLTDEEQFLREHLVTWVGEFCCEAEKYAQTDFYKGFLIFLEAFLDIELQFIQSQLFPQIENNIEKEK